MSLAVLYGVAVKTWGFKLPYVTRTLSRSISLATSLRNEKDGKKRIERESEKLEPIGFQTFKFLHIEVAVSFVKHMSPL